MPKKTYPEDLLTTNQAKWDMYDFIAAMSLEDAKEYDLKQLNYLLVTYNTKGWPPTSIPKARWDKAKENLNYLTNTKLINASTIKWSFITGVVMLILGAIANSYFQNKPQPNTNIETQTKSNQEKSHTQ